MSKGLIMDSVNAFAGPLAMGGAGRALSIALTSVTALAGPFSVSEPGGQSSAVYAKDAPTHATPIIVLWKNMSQLSSSHPAWSEKSCWVEATPSFQDYFNTFYSNMGWTEPASTVRYRRNNGPIDGGPDYTALTSNFILDVTPEELEEKVNAHAERDSQMICDCAYKQGLVRGAGPIGNGLYGGSWNHHELFTSMSFDPAAAPSAFTSLVYNGLDAALVPREAVLETGPSTTRTSTLFKLNIVGSFPGDLPDPGLDIQTRDNRESIETRSAGVRPGNFHHLINTNGIASARQYVEALVTKVKAKCDSYTPPGGGAAIQLTYPAFAHHSFEELGFGGAPWHASRFVTDPGGTGGGDLSDYEVGRGSGYYQIGVMWHVRASTNNLWDEETIFEVKDGDGDFTIARTYASAIENDPGLNTSAPGVTNYHNVFAPGFLASPHLPSPNQVLRFRRLTFNAADYALYKACSEPWKEMLPITEFCNFDFVVVKDENVPYKRASASGIDSIQTFIRMDRQGPSLYGSGSSLDPLVMAIKSASGAPAISAAVEAWNNANLPNVKKILDQIETQDPSIPSDAFVYGVYSVADLRDGKTSEGGWGGDAAFFKKVVKYAWQKGIFKFIIFAGDAGLTLDAWLEAKQEILEGNLT